MKYLILLCFMYTSCSQPSFNKIGKKKYYISKSKHKKEYIYYKDNCWEKK